MPEERTFVYEVAGGAHVAVHGSVSPHDEEWQRYLDDISEHLGEIRGVIVNTTGGGPSSLQRSMATEHWKRHGGGPKMSIMTTSAFVRGMVTALSWFLGPTVKAFPIEDYGDAAEHLGLGAAEVDEVRATVARLRANLPGA